MNVKLIGAFLTALLTFSAGPAIAQDEGQRASTGGAQTLEDILARQKGLEVDEGFRRDNLGDPSTAAPISGNLGTLGVFHSRICIVESDMQRQTYQSQTPARLLRSWSKMEGCLGY